MAQAILAALRGGLVVSCQPVPGGPLDRPDIVAAFALAALDGGAVGLRIEGLGNLRAVRAATSAPVIGLIKRDLTGSPVRITPLLQDVADLIDAGADIIACDATDRPRPVRLADLITAVRNSGRLIMADCATVADGQRAAKFGADVLGSTMSGYIEGPVPALPDLDLVTALARLHPFVIAEGRYQAPHQAAAAMAAGATAVVAGSAITRPEYVTAWFVAAISGGADG